MSVDLYECIWIKVIRMGMGDIDIIDQTEYCRIQSNPCPTFHEVSDNKIRKPSIDEKSNIVSIRIVHIDEKLSMSEWCDNHRKKNNKFSQMGEL
jgi:hypothetical protein